MAMCTGIHRASGCGTAHGASDEFATDLVGGRADDGSPESSGEEADQDDEEDVDGDGAAIDSGDDQLRLVPGAKVEVRTAKPS